VIPISSHIVGVWLPATSRAKLAMSEEDLWMREIGPFVGSEVPFLVLYDKKQ